VVSRASAAASTEGFGESPPNAWKCRSGSHTASKPCASAKRADAMSSLYFSAWNSGS
jgi:hypothetical protein